MKIVTCDSYEDMSSAAADIFQNQLLKKPESIFGLATGSTPLGLYSELVARFEAGLVDFSKSSSFNLDEYYPIKSTHHQSYHYFMEEHLFGKVNFASSRVPSGESDDPKGECEQYDAAIEAAGGIDLQLLGVGVNGHIGFNEPAATYMLSTHLTELAQSTIVTNSRFFAEGEIQPTSAITMGFGAIFGAKSILMLISGASKTPIVKKLLEYKIHTDIPASLLLLHPDFTVIIDKEALGT